MTEARSCIPCKTGTPPLDKKAAESRMAQVPGWSLERGATALLREFKFKNFKQALALVNQVGELAEKEGHHPDFTFGWGYVKLLLTTHSILGLHENDFIMASKINALLDSAK